MTTSPAQSITGRAAAATMRDVSLYISAFNTPLKKIHLTIARGEIFGLLGPRSSGKSSALKILAGRLRPSIGKVTVLGRSPYNNSVKQRIAYFSETAAETGLIANCARFFSAMLGRHNTSTDRNAALRAALAPKTELIIIDDAFSGLDAPAQQELKQLFLALARAGKTVIFSSDSFADAADISHRIGILNAGELQSHGAIHDYLASTETLRSIVPVLSAELLEPLLTKTREYTSALPKHSHSAEKPPQDLLATLSPTSPPPSTPITKPDPIDHKRLANLARPPS